MEWGKCTVHYTYSEKLLYKVEKNIIEQRMKNNKPYGHQLTYCIITVIAILSFSFLPKKKKAQTNIATNPVNII